MRDFFGRHIIAIGFCAIAAYSAYLYNQVWGSESAARNTQSFNYEMPRPKAYYGEFDLSGRRINRQVIRKETENKAAAAVLAKQQEAAKVAAKQVAAKKATDKDKDKKKKLADAKKKKSQVRVAMVDGAEGMGFKGESIHSNHQNYQTSYTAPAANAKSEGNTKNEEAKISAAQWKALLFAKPTQKNASEFVTAFKKGQVESKDYYGITVELLKDSEADRQKVALFILKADSSVKGFEILVTQHELQGEPLKSEIGTIIQTYATASKLAVLSRALYHSDPVIVKAATDVLEIAVAAQQNQGQSEGAPESSVNPAAFNVFVPALRRLATQEDPTLAALAQQLLNSIQAMLQA